MATQRLAALERLTLDASQRIEQGGDKEHDRGRNQTGGIYRNANELYDTHDTIDCRAHVIGFEFADEGVEFGRGWADAEEEWNFDEDDDEGADETYDAEDDEEVEVEYVGDAEREA
jgi:hypothetical protein